MIEKKEFQIVIDEQGRGILSPEMVSHYGLKPGMRLRLKDRGNGLGLHAGVFPPARNPTGPD